MQKTQSDKDSDNHANIVKYLGIKTNVFKTCCRLLLESKKNQCYKAFADSWEEYVASLGLTSTKANKMVKLASIFEALSNQKDESIIVDHIDEDRLLNDWMPCVEYDAKNNIVKNPDKVLELLYDAGELSYSDFKIVVNEHKQKEERPDIKPEFTEGPALDEAGGVIGNYKCTKASKNLCRFTVGLKGDYVEQETAAGIIHLALKK